jgi:hypothetical protein
LPLLSIVSRVRAELNLGELTETAGLSRRTFDDNPTL